MAAAGSDSAIRAGSYTNHSQMPSLFRHDYARLFLQMGLDAGVGLVLAFRFYGLDHRYYVLRVAITCEWW